MKSTTTSDSRNPKAGLGALLTPDNCVLILIDHQPFQFAALRSHDPQTIINNVVGLAKSAKIFGVPTLLTTVLERQGGLRSSVMGRRREEGKTTFDLTTSRFHGSCSG